MLRQMKLVSGVTDERRGGVADIAREEEEKEEERMDRSQMSFNAESLPGSRASGPDCNLSFSQNRERFFIFLPEMIAAL